MNQYTRIAVFISLCAINASIVQAEWYLGAGQIPTANWYELDDYSIDTTISHDTDPGIKFFSGYKASDFFSVELEYKDQMEFGVGNVFSGNELWLTDQSDVELESKTLFFTGISTFAIDETKRLYLRGGLYNWDLKSTNQNATDNSQANKSGTDIFYSVGSYFDVTERIGFSAEWERFEYENDDVDFISTEIHFNF
ncbi:MAG: outer membrane beta-barrel protein [Gammaproteobacteria bacterium]|nr:outer membrane beta-barrel protein [Gammaproteobacteria bacterium]